MMSILVLSFGDRFCVSRKVGTAGGGGVHLQGELIIAVSGLAVERPGHRKKPSHLVEPPSPVFNACFSVVPCLWHFSRDLIERLLIGECPLQSP